MNVQVSKRRAAAWIVATIVAPLAFSFVASGFYIGFWYAATRHQGEPPVDVILNGMLVGVPISLWATVGLWWLAHRRRASFSQLFATASSTPLADVALGIILGIAWVGMYGFPGVLTFQEMFTFDLDKLASVPTSLSAGFCEEWLYRGFVIAMIAGAGGGRTAQVAYSALAFGLAHVFWGPWGMAWTAALGLTLAMVTVWRKNVWAAVTAHTVLDLCIEPGLIEKALRGGFQS
jgi:membrane protease YdiL (CAAX protease family)